MKPTLTPKTPEELIVFLEQHNLEAIIDEIEISSCDMTSKFGFGNRTNIHLLLVCHDKDKEEMG